MDVAMPFVWLSRRLAELSTSSLLFTAGSVFVWVAVLRWALRKKGPYPSVLAMATLYCLASEFLAIRLGKYHYGDFLLAMPPWTAAANAADGLLAWLKARGLYEAINCPHVFSLDIPLEIALVEGALLFSVLRITDLLAPTIPRGKFFPLVIPFLGALLAKPLMDGLVALNVDAILDPVVSGTMWCGAPGSPGVPADYSGLQLWTWHTNEFYRGFWFGVPIANYTAWFAGTTAFTVSVRITEYSVRFGPIKFRNPDVSFHPLLVISFLAMLLVEFAVKFWLDRLVYRQGVAGTITWQFGVIGLVILVSALIAVWHIRHVKTDAEFEWTATAPKVFLFLYSGGALVFAGIYQRSWLLIPLFAATTAFGIYFVMWPFLQRKRKPRSIPPEIV
jgi:hypothetical protein